MSCYYISGEGHFIDENGKKRKCMCKNHGVNFAGDFNATLRELTLITDSVSHALDQVNAGGQPLTMQPSPTQTLTSSENPDYVANR